MGVGCGCLLGRSPEVIRVLSGPQPAVVLGGWWRGVVAGCGPGRTLMRLRLPDRGENHTPRPAP